MEIHIPDNVAVIMDKLEKNGFGSYIVGGCVRDAVMGNVPKDHDITTSASPDEIKQCLVGYDIIDTGLKHGTVTVVSDGENVEITTYRIDGEYTDHRHPETVSFSKDLSDDLSRRDLTINAMAYSEKTGIIDLFGGRKDIAEKKIRCVGEPERRFNEDALRIMRALRFSSVLGFDIDEETSRAIFKMKDLLKNVSAERISKELILLLMGRSPCKVLEHYHEVFEVFVPEIAPCVGFDQHNKYHAYDVWGHIARAVENSAAAADVRLALFLHDIGKPRCYTVDEKGTGHFHGHEKIGAEMADDILKRLKYPNVTIERVKKLINYHYFTPSDNSKFIKKLLSKVGEEDFFLLMEVMKADNRAKHDFCLGRVADIEKMSDIAEKIIADEHCFKVTDLSVNGNDMISLGYRGAEIGKILNYLLENVLNENVCNSYEELMKMASEYKIPEKTKKFQKNY